jgi:hypothetical protein
MTIHFRGPVHILVIICILIDVKRGRLPCLIQASLTVNGHPDLLSRSVSHVPPSLCDGFDGAGYVCPAIGDRVKRGKDEGVSGLVTSYSTKH